MDAFGLNIVFNFVDNASGSMMGVVGVFNQVNSAADSMSSGVLSSMQVFQSMSIVGSSLESLGNQAISMGEKVATSLGNVAMSVVDVGNQMFNARIRLNKLFEDSAGGGQAMLDWITQYAKTSVFEFENVLDGALMMKTAMIDVRDQITTTSGQTTQNVLDFASDLAAFNPSARNMYGTGVEAAMGAIKEYVAEGNAKSMQMGFSLDITGILGEDKGGTAEERMQQIADLIEKVGMTGMTANLAGTAQNQLSNLSDIFFILKSKIADSGIYDFYTEMVTQISEAFAIGDEEMDSLAKTLADALMELAKPIRFVINSFKEAVIYIRQLAQEHPGIFKLGVKIATMGSILLIVGGVALVVAGSIMKLVAGFGMMSVSMPTITGVLTLIGTSLSHLVAVIAPIIVAIVALKYAWDNNLFGMRDTLERAFGDIYNTLRITFNFLRDGYITLEDYQLAEAMGVTPFIMAMLNLQHAWGTFVDAFKAGFDSVHQGFQDFASQFEPIILPIREVFAKIGESMNMGLGPENENKWQGIGTAIGKIVGIASIALPVIMTLVKVVGLITNPVGLVVTIIVAAIAFLKHAWENNLGGIQEKTAAFVEAVKSFVTSLPEKLAPIHEFFKKAFDKCAEVFKTTLLPLIKSIVGFVVDVAKTIGTVFMNNIVPALKRVVDIVWTVIQKVAGFLAPVINVVITTVGKLLSWVGPALTKVADWLTKAFNGGFKKVITGAIEFVGSLIDAITAVVDFLMPIISVIIDVVIMVWEVIWEYAGTVFSFLADVLGNVFTLFVDIFGNVFNVICDVVGAIIGVVGGICEFIAGVFSGDWEKAWNGIVKVFTSIWDGIVGIIKGVINGIISAVNFCIRGINKLEVPDWVNELVGHEVSINIPEIPMLSTGGEVKKEGLSVIHPAEVVVNSETTTQLKKFLNSQKASSNHSGDGDIVLNFDKGSVVVHIEKAEEQDLNQVADKLISVIMRKIEKKKMSIRNPIGGGAY